MCMILPFSTFAQPTPTPPPADFVPLRQSSITAESALLMDSYTGKILFSKSANVRRFPASTTKLMTALLAFERGNITTMVTTDDACRDIGADSTQIGLLPKEMISLNELLHGLLIASGNDCANAIAVHIGGNVKDFVSMMNKRAQELGMTNTHFVNAHGLHHVNHYTTANDMAILVQELLKHPLFTQISSLAKYTIPATNLSDARQIITTNHLLRGSEKSNQNYYDACIGGKTGYTAQAGGCFVAVAQKQGMRLIAIVMKDNQNNKWASVTTLFEHGVTNYRTINLMDIIKSKPMTVQVADVAQSDELGGLLLLEPKINQALYFTDKRAAVDQILTHLGDLQIITQPTLTTLRAPIYKGQTVCEFSAIVGGQTMAQGKYIATRDVTEKSGQMLPPILPMNGSLKVPAWFSSPLQWLAVLLVVVALALVILKIVVSVKSRRYKRRRRVRMRTRIGEENSNMRRPRRR